MQKWFMSFALACGCSIALVHVATAQVQIQVQAQRAIQVQALPVQANATAALRVAIAPGFNNRQLSQADAIFVGRVVAFEPMDVKASPAAGQPNANYRIAVVQVSDAIFGLKKGTKTVRVGFIAAANGGPLNGPNGGPGAAPGGVQILPINQPAIQQIRPGFGRRPFPGMGGINLTVGQDGMFALVKHHKENFYTAPAYNSFVQRQNNPNFDTEIKTAKQLAKVMGNPVAGLKADDAQDRYMAAAVLIARYRSPNNPTGAPMKQQPIDADQSKLILKAIAGGNWGPNRVNGTVPSPYDLFNQLGINANDGYRPVNIRNQQDLGQAMQKWLDENAGKFRINQMVVDPNAKVPQPGVQPGVIRPGIRPGVRPLPVQILPVQGVPAPPARVNPPQAQDTAPALPPVRNK